MHFVVQEIRLDSKLRNIVSKFKSDNIYPLLAEKRPRTGKMEYFASFHSFLAKSGSYVIRFDFCDYIWNPLIEANLLDHKMKAD